MELLKGRKQFHVNKLLQVGACHAVDVVRGAVGFLGGCPLAPAQEARDDALVLLACHHSVHLSLTLQVVKVFQEQQPRGLLDVVQLR